MTLANGKALRYGIGVGREGFTWSGVERISRKTEWPDWIPPVEMIARQPYLPRWVGGGPGNPLGARALYLGNTAYRIHGTNNPASIGKHVSSGCIRLRDADVIDLYGRVGIGTKVSSVAERSAVCFDERSRARLDRRRPRHNYDSAHIGNSGRRQPSAAARGGEQQSGGRRPLLTRARCPGAASNQTSFLAAEAQIQRASAFLF